MTMGPPPTWIRMVALSAVTGGVLLLLYRNRSVLPLIGKSIALSNIIIVGRQG